MLLWAKGFCALYKVCSKYTLLNKRQAGYMPALGYCVAYDIKTIPSQSSKPVSGFVVIILGA